MSVDRKDPKDRKDRPSNEPDASATGVDPAGSVPAARDVTSSLEALIAEVNAISIEVGSKGLGEERSGEERPIQEFGRRLSSSASGARRLATAGEEPATVRTQKVRAVRVGPRSSVLRLSAAISVVGVAIAVVLVGRGRFWGPERGADPAKIPAPETRAIAGGGTGGAGTPAAAPPSPSVSPSPAAPPLPPAPEPVVRSMLPAEPMVTPLDDRTGPGRRQRRRPGRGVRQPGWRKALRNAQEASQVVPGQR